MKPLPTVAQIMDTDFVIFDAEMPLRTAVEVLWRKRLFGACVVDGAGKVVGVLSERECLKAYLEAFEAGDPKLLEQKTVAEIVAPECQTVSSAMEMFQLAQLLLDNEFRRVPVVDAEGRLAGQVTRRDLVRAIRQFGLGESLRTERQ